MKKSILLLALFLQTFSFAAPLRDLMIDRSALQSLATELGIAPGADLTQEIIKRGLRTPGQERWEMKELSPEQRLFVLNWAETQGLFSECAPIEMHYDKVLIFGATEVAMQLRLHYLIELWERGVRFEEIIWLTGDCVHIGSEQSFNGISHNESESAHFLWENTPIPQEMRELSVTFVVVPMKLEQGVFKRPNTADTLYAWLQREKEPCKALFISTQPFCGYQFAILKTAMPESFSFDCAAPQEDPFSHPVAAAITLDAIARQLWLEDKMRP